MRCGEHHKRYKGKCNEGRKKETYLINSLLSGIRHSFNCCDHCTNVTTEIKKESEVRLRMASYEDIKGELRKRINLPENQLRGMTEATGLRILDAVYQTGELLRQHLTDGADKTTQNPDE